MHNISYITIGMQKYMSKTKLSIIALTVIVVVAKLWLEVDNNEHATEIEQSIKMDMTTNMVHKTISIQGTEIHYFSNDKQDAESILFLHPAFSDHSCFDNQIDFFAEHFNVITVDLLGHGLSSVGKSKDKIDQSAQHINQILIRENIEKAHIVGVSMGSLLAQDFTLKFPSKTLAVITLGGYDINSIYPEINKAQRKEMFKWLFKVLFSMDAFRRYAASVSAIKENEQANFYKSTEGFTRKSFIVMSALGNIIAQREGNIRSYPLLILSGEKDNELALQVAHKWHDKEPESRFHIVKNAGHCANMDNPIEFNKIVLDFITNK